MKLFDWLRKLGILRWGTTSGVYHNALERPQELQQPDIFNAKKDLVNLPPDRPVMQEIQVDDKSAKR